MSAAEKFRVLTGAARDASAKADNALRCSIRAEGKAISAGAHVYALIEHLGLEVVKESAGENQIRIRYRRKLPRWFAWVRKIGVCR